MPRPLAAVERREAVALGDSPTRRARDVQRIEQGMGRGVRDVSDHCAVLLLGAELGMAVHDRARRDYFSPATRAQLDLSLDVALQLYGQGLDGIRAALTVCLDRDPHWVQRSKLALAPVRYINTGAVRAEAVATREAFDLAATGQTSQAADRLQRAINEITDPALRGYASKRRPTCTSPTPPQHSGGFGAAIRETRWCCAR